MKSFEIRAYDTLKTHDPIGFSHTNEVGIIWKVLNFRANPPLYELFQEML